MNRQSKSTTAGAPARPWWSGRDSRVAALTAGVAVVTLLAHLTVLRLEQSSLTRDIVVLCVIGAMSVVTEGLSVHLRVRRGGHAMGLSEIPLVLGLLTAGPLALLVGRVVGGAIGMAVVRRQRGVKLAFNTALLGIQATVASIVFAALAGSAATLGPRQWLAAFAAMLIAEALIRALITAVIALHDDPGEWRRLPSAVVRGLPFVIVTTSLALSGVLLMQLDPRSVVLLAVLVLVTFLGYRGYVRQTQGHAQVEGLYAFTRALDGALDGDQVTRTLLDQVRDQLRAEIAELLVPDADGGGWTRTRMSGAGKVETTALPEPSTAPWWVAAAEGRPVLVRSGDHTAAAARPVDGIAVPVTVGAVGTGVLLVTDSLGDIPTFGADQVRLFQALANHASLSLANSALVHRLRAEVSEKEHQALHDQLTGLPNRRHFHLLLETRLGTPASGITAVMLMDIDRFKEVNDALGHDTGDALLREVAERLRNHLGDRGVIARLGGDEFGILLSGLRSIEDAVRVGDDLTHAIEQPIAIGHLHVNTRASIGIACGPQHGDAAQILMQRADVAMYAAKQTRAGVRVYEQHDDTNSADRLALVADLARAIQHRDLTVEFQPKLDPTSGLVTGAEALARWHHREQGSIPPDVFIALAEHSGLIRPLTLHVLELALRRCAAWRRAGHDLHVAVNLSPNALLDDTLPDVVTRLLGQSGVPAAALILEITESTIMADPTGSMSTLDRLNAIGVKLAIDDFGTGYSSLGRLRELPIHEVKIDKSFVQRIAIDHRDRAVVRSAIQLGHALDLEVVAEGVEDGMTLAHLQREGCNIVQGFYISKPLPADEFETWLAGRTSADRTVVYPRFGT